MIFTAYSAGPDWYRRRHITKLFLLMKFIIFFLLISIAQVNAKGWAQTITWSGKNVPVEKVLELVRKQTGYEFFYRTSDLKDSKPVTMQSRNMPLAAFLDEVFKDQPLQYIIQNKNIIVSRKPAREKDHKETPALNAIT